MDEGMIWNNYYKHRKKELRERFPQIGRIGTNDHHDLSSDSQVDG